MAKIRIEGVSYDQSNYTIHIILIESQTVEGEDVDAPLGEAFVKFPTGTEIADIKKKIVKAAQEIFDAHKNAQDKRQDIAELEFPDIT